MGLLTGMYASENPFSIEKNIQKIDQEESNLLNILKKERISDEEVEDIVPEKSIADVLAASEKNATGEKSTGSAEIAPIEAKPAVKEKVKSTPKESPATPAANSAKNPPAKQAKTESASNTAESNSTKKEALKAEPKKLTIKKDSTEVKAAETEMQEAKKTEPEKTAVEKEIKVVDSKIKELEERLESMKEKKEGEPKEVIQEIGQQEKNSTLDEELQEAIRSVED